MKVLLHHGRFLNFVHSMYDGGHVNYMGDMDLEYFSVMHMMETFTNELKYKDIAELWCFIREEKLEIGLSCLHNNEDVLQISERLE